MVGGNNAPAMIADDALCYIESDAHATLIFVALKWIENFRQDFRSDSTSIIVKANDNKLIFMLKCDIEKSLTKIISMFECIKRVVDDRLRIGKSISNRFYHQGRQASPLVKSLQ